MSIRKLSGFPNWLFGLVAGLAFASPAMAQETFTVASGPQTSSTYSIGLSVAKVAGIDLRVRPFRSTTQATVLVDSGELNFGLASAPELAAAHSGTGLFEGQAPLSKLRLVAALHPFRTGLAVKKDDPAQTLLELKGRNVPSGWRTQPAGLANLTAILASVGMSYEDVVPVEVSDSRANADGFASGTIDVIAVALGAVNTAEIDQAVGGIRVLSLGDGPEALERVKAVFPTARITRVEPEPGIAGVFSPINVLEYDYYIYANESTPDAAVRSIVEGIVNGKEEMQQIVAAFRYFDPANVAHDIGVPFHPAAEAYYREKGLWPNP